MKSNKYSWPKAVVGKQCDLCLNKFANELNRINDFKCRYWHQYGIDHYD